MVARVPSPIRRGEGSGARMGGPSWSPASPPDCLYSLSLMPIVYPCKDGPPHGSSMRYDSKDTSDTSDTTATNDTNDTNYDCLI